MKRKKLRIVMVLTLLMCLFFANKSYSQSKVVIGYIPTWTNMQSVIDNADLNILTHINISFVNPNSSGVVMSGGEPVCCDASAATINYVVNKAHQNGVKVLASLAGGSVPSCSGNWASLLQPGMRTTVVNNLVAFANYFNLDGIDVDIEGSLLNSIDQAGNYTPFIQALKAGLNPLGKLVTCATASYNGGMVPVSSIPYFDYINLMSYDNNWGSTGNHSTYADAVAHMQLWLSRGCPANKLVLGVPFYGYTSTVGTGGTAFSTIVSQYPDAAYVDSYAGYNYNGIPTIEAKTQYAVENGAGVMIWQIAQDAPGDLSLLQAIGRKIGSNNSETGVSGLNGTYIIENRNSGMVMDVANGDPANGTNILQWNNTGATNQQFTLNEISTGVYSMISVATGKCIDIDGVSTENFANVHQWDYVGGGNQQFKALSTGDGFYKFKASHSNKIIEVGYASLDADANINQYDDNNQICGQWRLLPVSGTSWSTKIEAETYINMSGIDVEACSEGGQNVGWIDAGDWMVWDVNIPSSGTYTIEYRVASANGGGTIQLEKAGGSPVYGSISVPSTGGWQNWTTISHSVSLTAGEQQLAIAVPAGGYNINWIQITNGLKSAQALYDEIGQNNGMEINVYPNPAKDIIHIDMENGAYTNMQIVDYTGKVIINKNIENYISKLSVPISGIDNGVYILKLSNSKSVKTLKIIKN